MYFLNLHALHMKNYVLLRDRPVSGYQRRRIRALVAVLIFYNTMIYDIFLLTIIA